MRIRLGKTNRRRPLVQTTTVEVFGIRMGYTTAFEFLVVAGIVFALCVSLTFRIFRIRKAAHEYYVRLDPHGFTGRGMCWLLSIVGALALMWFWQSSVAVFNGGPRDVYGVTYTAAQLSNVAEWMSAGVLLITIVGAVIAWVSEPDMRAYIPIDT